MTIEEHLPPPWSTKVELQSKIIMDYIKIANQKVEVYEYQTDAYERDRYGLSVNMFTATCSMWEYYMPVGTIRDKAHRDTETLWADFIRGDNSRLLMQFVDILSSATGYNIHIANKSTIPLSVYDRLSRCGATKYYGDVGGDCFITLIFYANNQ